MTLYFFISLFYFQDCDLPLHPQHLPQCQAPSEWLISCLKDDKLGQTLGDGEGQISLACFILLDFEDVTFFNKLKVCGHPALNMSIGAVFCNRICLLCVFVSHFGNTCNISNIL